VPPSAGFGWLLAEDTGSISAMGSGNDGLWLGHDWVDGHKSVADLAGLAAHVRSARIRDLFVHVGPLTDSGVLDPRLRPRAQWLVDAVHQELPGVRVQAWIGAVAGSGRLSLDDPATRGRILAGDRDVLTEGFDGVHYDFEPVQSGDQGYLTLLTDTHTMAKAHRAVVSIASDQVEPLPGLRYPEQWVFGRPHWWSTGYLHDIAGRVDEIALMTYDSGMPTEGSFSGYLRREAELALDAVPPTVTVLIGVPAYRDGEPGHTSAETVPAALRGLRLAVSDNPGRPVGAAIYAEYTATAQDWHDYQTDWVTPGQ
jgi:hypothetical protein